MLKRQLMSDGFWVTTAQLASAVGALATVRVLTELLTPSTFGFLALGLGVITLAQGLLCTPILQALLRYYPDYNAKGRAAALCKTTKQILVRRASYSVVLGITAACVAYLFLDVPFWLIVLLSIFLFVEIWRSYEGTLFNPTRRQKPFAAVMIFDAGLRPTLAWLFVRITGLEVEAVLAAFITSSVVTATVSRMSLLKEHICQELGSDRVRIESQIQAFSLPILPLAIIGWCNGTLDRYVIAGILGSGHVGLYAAAYGLVSRPFLMMSQALEQTFRPCYYEATSRNDTQTTAKYFQVWVSLASIAAVVGFLFIYSFAEPIAKIFLSEAFWQSAHIMPWIALAYGIIGVVQALEIRLYAHYQARRVLIIEIAGIGTMFASLLFLVKIYGLVGAAIALCIGAVVQISVSLMLIFGQQNKTTSPMNLSNVERIDLHLPSVETT
jgi:O-antigen/teichoic acid export membrane protein